MIKLIYIDPPYNTGKDFIYETISRPRTEFRLKRARRTKTDRAVANSDSSGRYHFDWMSMMYARLTVAKRLCKMTALSWSASTTMSSSALRKLMDRVFGERNFVAQLVWERSEERREVLFRGSRIPRGFCDACCSCVNGKKFGEKKSLVPETYRDEFSDCADLMGKILRRSKPIFQVVFRFAKDPPREETGSI